MQHLQTNIAVGVREASQHQIPAHLEVLHGIVGLLAGERLIAVQPVQLIQALGLR